MTPAGPAATVVPAWLHRAGAISWRFLAIAGLGAVLVWTAFLLGTVTASVLLALIVSATVAPMVRRLRARGWSESGSAAAMTAAALGIGVGVFLLLLLALLPDMPGVVAAIQSGLDEARDELSSVSVPPDVVARIRDVASGVASWIAAWVGGIVGSIAGTVTVVILALFLTYYMLTDGQRAWAWTLQGTEGERRRRIEASGRDALERVGGYLRGTSVQSAARAIAFGLFMGILGVPQAVPLAVLVFVGGFIPYLGGLVAMVTVLLVAVGSVGPSVALILLALMAVTNALIANLLRPAVYGRSVHLHPAIVLVVLPIGGAVAGIIGLLAAIPVAAIVVAIGGAAVAALEPDRVPGQDREVSGWVDHLAQWSWRLLAAIASAAVVLFVIGQAPLVVTPVVLAAIIAATVAPLARALRERGWGPSRAAMAVTGSAYLVILALVVLAFTQLAAPLGDAIRSSVAGAEQLEDDAAGTLGWVGSLARVIGSDLLGVVASVLEAVAAVSVVLVLAALLSFYLVRDAPRAWEAVLARARPWRREALDDTGRRSAGLLGSYMLGTAAISAVGAISQLAIMVILGLPFAVPIAILSFIACFIPYIGGFITTGMAFLIAVAFGTPTEIVIMFIYTIVINIVQGNIVTPLVYGRAVNLHPAVVLLAIPAGGAVAGIAGMFLAVPLLALVAASWRTVLYVMGDRPMTPPPVDSQRPAGVAASVPALEPSPGAS